MGGKSYYCDYCDCSMKNDINVRKSHNNGMAHNIAKANDLAQYKDPQQIINEEKKKIPCKRFLNKKECSFGFFCHYSHYSPEELAYLEWIVDTKESGKVCPVIPNDNMPWKYPKDRKRLIHQHQLPPSLHPIDFNKATESCFQSQWG